MKTHKKSGRGGKRPLWITRRRRAVVARRRGKKVRGPKGRNTRISK